MKVQNTFREALENDNYEYLLSNFKQMLLEENIQIDLKDKYEAFIIILFKLRNFEKCFELYETLRKQKIESMILVTYAILSNITIDKYLCLSIINKSDYLKLNINNYSEEGGANYSNLLKENEDIQFSMIIYNFAKEVYLLSCPEEEIVVKYYELISFLFELRYSKEIIKRLDEIGYILFN